MTFSDVIDRYGRNIRQEHLESAYNRVGRSFSGQLAQNFVVLKDIRETNPVVSSSKAGGGRPGVGNRSGAGRGVGIGRGFGRGGAQATLSSIQCHFCKEMGHYKGDCPKNAKGSGRGYGRGSTPRGAPTPRGNTTPNRPNRKRARSDGQQLHQNDGQAPGRAPKGQRVEWGTE